MSRAKRVLLVTVLTLVISVVALWAASYHPREFRGGIGIRDSGFFSYPRYHAQLGQMPLWTAGEYRFSVRGLPPGPLDFALRVVGATYADSAQLTSLPTAMSVSIVDGSGHVLCTASGKLSDAQRRGLNSWVLESSSLHASFWHPQCLQLPISRSKEYVATVKISDAGTNSPHKIVIPVLEGGGMELP
jgi:hypothetical protein